MEPEGGSFSNYTEEILVSYQNQSQFSIPLLGTEMTSFS